MGWFDEQIRLRKQSDQELFEDAFAGMAGAVLGSGVESKVREEGKVSQGAIEDVLRFYHVKPGLLPEGITDLERQLTYLLRPSGLMHRRIRLTKGWQRSAIGPMIGRLQSGEMVALLPSGLRGYAYKDPVTEKKVYIGKKTASLLEGEAIAFYKPFPLRRLALQDLFRYIAGCFSVWDGVFLMFIMAATSLLGLLMPKITRAMLGPVLRAGSLRVLMAITVFLVCITISSSLLGVMHQLIYSRFERKLRLQVEAASMLRVLSLPAVFFKRFSSGEISERMQSLNQLCRVLFGTLTDTALSSLLSLVYITQIRRFAPVLVVPALAVLISTVVVSTWASLAQTSISKRQMELEARTSGLTYALIGGIQKIRLSGAEKRAFSKWAQGYSQGVALEYNPPFFLRTNSVIVSAIGTVGTVVFYYLAVKSRMAVEDYYAFQTAYGMVMGAFSSLAGLSLVAADIKPILDMAKPILDEEPESAGDREMVKNLSGSIELSRVSFRYGEDRDWIIDDLSLKIGRGEYVAIVGATGSGKSTLMRLLLGFETPQRGAVYYDGKDLSRLDVGSVRRSIGSVIQNGKLFPGDIFSNVAICAPNLTQQGAWEACEIAGIADDIRAMPMQLQTVISEGGGGISGGQRQRILIARAIAPKPKILMFDEATSALDNKTQKQVSDALEGLKCTRIVIAHRLSTIRHCDRILVLQNGRIEESGTYEELMERGGYFAELVKRQTVRGGKQ